jgi:lipopolysaccharide transport system permease protein
MEATAAPSIDYFRRIWKLRWFWYSLVENDLHARYRHSFLGIGWSLARPLGLTLIFCVVFSTVFHVRIDTYAPYVLVGLTLWQFFVENVTLGCRSFHTGAAYIRQQAVPLAIFPLRTTLGAAFHTGVALLLGLSVTWFFQGFNNLAALPWILPSMALLFVLGWSVATVCGLAQTHFPDTCYILELALQFLFYLSGIMFRPQDLSNNPMIAWVMDCNPLWSVLELIRQPVLHGQAPPWHNVVISLVFVGTMAALACVSLRKLERKLVFWI